MMIIIKEFRSRGASISWSFMGHLVNLVIILCVIPQTYSSAAELSSISLKKSLHLDNTREYLYWVQNKITMLQSYLYSVKVKYPDAVNNNINENLALPVMSTMNLTTSSPVPVPSMKYSKFCRRKASGYYPQPGNCNQYRGCSENYELSNNNCATCSKGTSGCCNGRLCWQPTSPNSGVCTWCKSDCECYPPFR